MSYDEVYKQLEAYGQLHLLNFYDSLDDMEKEQILHQIASIDFTLLELVDKKEAALPRGTFSPIPTLTVQDIEQNKTQYLKLGIDAIKQGKVGAVLLAGGQGTRLGFDKPKGMFNVGITKTIYIFDLLVQNLLEVVKHADAWVPFYIMTSTKNNSDIIDFFNQNNYFGYNKDFIFFFTQEMAPSVDYEGKIYLEDKKTLSLSPNGNGGWFSSLVKAGQWAS